MQIDGHNYFATVEQNKKNITSDNDVIILLKQITNSNKDVDFKFLTSYKDELKNTHKKYNVSH